MKVNPKDQRDKLTRHLFTSAVLIQCVASASPALANGNHFQAHQRGNNPRHVNQNANRPNQSHFGLGTNALQISKQNLVNRHANNFRLQNVPNIDLNLNSELDSIVLSQDMIRRGESVTINVNGTSTQFNVGDKVSAGELVAIRQSQSNRGQTIELDSSGRAVGGTFSLDKIASGRHGLSVNDMVIPQNVNATDLISKRTEVNLSGDLVNYGSITEISRGGRVSASLSAQNISNQETGLISTVGGNGSVDLTLQANNVTNLGTIESSGDLRINSPLTNNSGRITSVNGNITLDTATVQNMAINNTNGVLSAINGDINIRDTAYSGAANAQVIGGDLLSRNLNLNSGAGTIDVNVQELTSSLQSKGTAVHVRSNTDTLVIGSQCLTGDPVYYNDAGNISITGNIVVAERLVILAKGDITTTAGVTNIKAQDGTGQGFDITMVAGASLINLSADPTAAIGTTPPIVGNTVGNTALANGSPGAKNIDFSLSPTLTIESNSTGVGQNGGNITLAAFGGGSVLLANGSNLNASASIGTSGKIIVLGGNKINIGSISNGATEGATDVEIFGSLQKFSSGVLSVGFKPDGTTTSSFFITGSTPSAASSINIAGNIISNTTSITGGGNIVLNGDITSPGGIAIIAGHNISTGAAGVDVSASSKGNAGNIVIAAGADMTFTNTSATINGASTTGGLIDFFTNASGNITANSLTTGTGGQINIAAYTGTDNTGTIEFPASIQARGSGAFDNGAISVVAGSTNSSKEGMNVGSFNLSGGNLQTGVLNLQTGKPGAATVNIGSGAGLITAGSLFATALSATDLLAGSIVAPQQVNINVGRNMTVGLIDVTNGATGNGGKVFITSEGTTKLIIGKLTLNSIFGILANGGATSGNAGSVSITTKDTDIDVSLNSINQSVTVGTGGSLTLNAGAGLIQLASNTLSLDAAGGDFNGGFIDLTADSITAPSPLTISANGSGTGNGGGVSLTLNSGGPVNIDPTTIILQAKGGASAGSTGGTVNISVPNNQLVLDGLSIDVHTQATDGSGGQINLLGPSIISSGSQPLALDVGGTGNGDGGGITITTGTASIGINNGDYDLSANAGGSSGNAGSISVTTDSNLTVNPTGLALNASGNGNGGLLVLSAGQAGTGNLLVNGSLIVNGAGGGNGGSVQLISNSATPFIIGGKKVTNGITGTVSALGLINGSLTVSNQGGGVTQGVDLTQFDSISLSAGAAGSVISNKTLGGTNTSNINLSATGTGNITAKKTLTADFVSFTASGGFIGGKKALKVLADTVDANASGQVNITDSSTNAVSLNNSNSTASSFTFRSAGDINVNGAVGGETFALIETTAKDGSINISAPVFSNTNTGTVSILATGKGLITFNPGPFDAAQAFNVNLETGNSVIGTNITPVSVSATNLSIINAGITFVNANNFVGKNVNLNAANSELFTFESSNPLFVNASLKTAKVIDISTNFGDSNITFNTSIGGKVTQSLTIAADGAGNIEQSSSKLKFTSVATIISSGTGNIGSAGTALNLVTTAAQVNTAGTGLVNLISSGKDPFAIGDSTAGGDFKLVSSGQTTLGDIAAQDVFLSTTGGQLSIGNNSKITSADGSITFQNFGKGKGSSITVGDNAQIISAATAPGDGAVTFVIGTLPAPQVVGTAPVGITITGGTTVFFNNGITVPDPTGVVLTSVNTNINFSAGKVGATGITLGKGVIITADPPLPAPTVTLPETARVRVLSSIDGASSTNQTTDMTNSNSSNSFKTNFSNVTNSSQFGDLASALLTVGSNMPLIETLVASQASSWISDTELDTGEIPAELVMDSIESDTTNDATSNDTPARSSGARTNCGDKLNKGSLLVAASQDKRFETRFGTVSVAGNSLVLLMTYKNGIAIFNLHDSRRDAVGFSIGDKQFSVAPGHSMFVTEDSVRSFDQINPAQLVAYRGIAERSHGNGFKTFHAQFSVPTAINAVKPLKELLKSRDPHASKIAKQFLKTTSILLQLHGNGADFRQFVKPAVAACLPN